MDRDIEDTVYAETSYYFSCCIISIYIDRFCWFLADMLLRPWDVFSPHLTLMPLCHVAQYEITKSRLFYSNTVLRTMPDVTELLLDFFILVTRSRIHTVIRLAKYYNQCGSDQSCWGLQPRKRKLRISSFSASPASRGTCQGPISCKTRE